jgi:hypothetical protein
LLRYNAKPGKVLTPATAEMVMEFNIPDETRSTIPGTKKYW